MERSRINNGRKILAITSENETEQRERPKPNPFRRERK